MDLEQDMSEAGPERPDSPQGEEIIVRADEVDEAGADISEITSTDDRELGARVEARREQDRKNVGSPKPLANAVDGLVEPPPRRILGTSTSSRPILRREASAPPPPPRQPPPPAPPPQQDESQNPTDSLSLAQLRNIVTNLPKIEPTAYAYTYDDTRIFPEELEEWFQYTEEDRSLLFESKQEFQEKIEAFKFDRPIGDDSNKWLKLPIECREIFVQHQLQGLKDLDAASTTQNLECINYIATGVWQESTESAPRPNESEQAEFEAPNNKYLKTTGQLKCIRESAELLCRLGAPQLLYDVIRTTCDNDMQVVHSVRLFWKTNLHHRPSNYPSPEFRQLTDYERTTVKFIKDRQLNAALTTLYFIVESGREQVKRGAGTSIRQAIGTRVAIISCSVANIFCLPADLEPELMHYLTQLIAKLRWDDTSSIPFTKVCCSRVVNI